MELSDKKFAVLIDADNISHRKIKDILDEIANYGTPTIKRIYGDFTDPKFAAWKSVLLENSITPIQQYAYTSGKNATDSALIIDAMDILHKESVNGFCIVSSDSDYTRLASRIRESGREVLGFGEKKTPKPFIKSCDKFIYVEILGQSAPAPAPVSAPAQTAAAVPAAKAATPKKTAKKHQGRNAPETDMPEAAVAEHVAAEAAPAEPAAAEKKVAPAPDTAQPQPIIRPIDDDFKTLLANTIEDAADDSGWAFSSTPEPVPGRRPSLPSRQPSHAGTTDAHAKYAAQAPPRKIFRGTIPAGFPGRMRHNKHVTATTSTLQQRGRCNAILQRPFA